MYHLPSILFLIFLFFQFNLVVYGSDYTGACVCNCCLQRSGICLNSTTGNFTVNDCESCTQQQCKERFPLCRAAGASVSTTCTDQTTWFDVLMICFFLVLIGIVFILSILRYKVDMIKKIFPVSFT